MSIFKKLFSKKRAGEKACVPVSKDGYECAYLRDLGTADVSCELHRRAKDTAYLRLGTHVRVAYGHDSIDGEVTALFRSGFEVKSHSWDGEPFWENFRYTSLIHVLA